MTTSYTQMILVHKFRHRSTR